MRESDPGGVNSCCRATLLLQHFLSLCRRPTLKDLSRPASESPPCTGADCSQEASAGLCWRCRDSWGDVGEVREADPLQDGGMEPVCCHLLTATLRLFTPSWRSGWCVSAFTYILSPPLVFILRSFHCSLKINLLPCKDDPHLNKQISFHICCLLRIQINQNSILILCSRNDTPSPTF